MKLKKVVRGTELIEKMHIAINLLCDTVKATLGPKGNNIIIDHSAFTPFITNDGVTIAENIESEDAVINTILELAKEASIKTNSTVGDGTTTTLVLLQSIFNEGLKEIESGTSPIILKKRMNEDLDLLKGKITNLSKKPTSKDLEHIAITSAGSKEIGKIINEAYLKVSDKGAIRIKEGEEKNTRVIYKNGYVFDTLLASPYFLVDKDSLELISSYLLLVNTYLSNIEELAIYINEAIISTKNLIIIAEDYSDDLINDVLALNQESPINVYLLKTPEFGKNKQDLLRDIELISKAKIIENLHNSSTNSLGIVSNLKITPDESTIYFEQTEKIKEKIVELRSLQKKKLSPDSDFLAKRIAMYESGIVDILVGAPTKTERREKKMRYDDALCAISSTKSGVLPGSGLALYKITEELSEGELKESLLKKVLQTPFKQIMTNAGLDAEKILQPIKDSNYQQVYNIQSLAYESIQETTVIDSTLVIVNALENAISIASLLLTTTALVINEYQNNAHKENSYTEL